MASNILPGLRVVVDELLVRGLAVDGDLLGKRVPGLEKGRVIHIALQAEFLSEKLEVYGPIVGSTYSRLAMKPAA